MISVCSELRLFLGEHEVHATLPVHDKNLTVLLQMINFQSIIYAEVLNVSALDYFKIQKPRLYPSNPPARFYSIHLVRG